jgi:hypothetical protein
MNEIKTKPVRAQFFQRTPSFSHSLAIGSSSFLLTGGGFGACHRRRQPLPLSASPFFISSVSISLIFGLWICVLDF